ncbi:mitochondrial inner membrane translocase subunit Tim17/Tim22/Tim23/peroxisomal protein PMP24 [Syncephalis fuscata]|nr:mitochondrial inner membrane translocase subunit Tim17/Tim22/Tim23/peroxisomal protein PMP24 [Syncephalis fuscata]
MLRSDYSCEPCPWIILNDMGGAFAMGAIGGGIWHSVKGARNTPRGERFYGSISAVRARAPVLGGNFAVWGGSFSAFVCGLQDIRQKKDAWNSIMSGALTSGVLAACSGIKPALISAAFGDVFLGIIEGVSIMLGVPTPTPLARG